MKGARFFTGTVGALLLIVAGVLFLSQTHASKGDVAFGLTAFAAAIIVIGAIMETTAIGFRSRSEMDRGTSEYASPVRRTGTL